MISRTCPCCTYKYASLLYTTPTKQQIVSCDRCNMVYAINTALIDYSKDSIYASSTYDAQAGHYRSIVANAARAAGITTSSSILDVGCATGGLMEAFIAAGFTNISGISLSQAEVDCCLAKGLNARVSGLDMWPSEQYDLVTISHVLEHVPDVQEFLTDLKSWVNVHGSVYIEVPNAQRYVPYFTSICQGFNSEHINHFDLKHLERACVGMEVYDKSSYESFTEGKREYPVIWVLAHPHAAELEASIMAYVERLEDQLFHMKKHLHKELEGVKYLAIWGMGQTTRLLVPSGLIPKSVTIVAVTDSNPVYHGQQFSTALVYPPEDFNPPPNVPILVCSQLSQVAVIKRIQELGLTNRIITLEAGK